MMNHDLEVSQSVDVNAPLAKVWDALINPDLIKEYLYGTETVTNWKVGSELVFQGEWEGHKYKDRGVIKEFVPLKKISYSYWSGFTGLEDKPENYSTVTYLLEQKDPNTVTFTWIQKGFKDETGYDHSKNGMPAFLEGVKKVMEK